MKTILQSLMLLLTALVTLTASAAMASDNITLQVDMKGLHKPHAGNDSSEEHHRWLEVTASAMSLDQPKSVTLEWCFFADDLSTGKVVEHARGFESLEMQPGRPARLRGTDTVFSYVRQHSERSGGGRRPVYKKVEASGFRYHGWAVTAWVDGKVFGEAYSSRDIAEKMKEN
jgi:hypothetical protein